MTLRLSEHQPTEWKLVVLAAAVQVGRVVRFIGRHVWAFACRYRFALGLTAWLLACTVVSACVSAAILNYAVEQSRGARQP